MSGPWEGNTRAHEVDQPAAEARKELRSLVAGGLLALALTAIAFAVAVFRLVPAGLTVPVIGGLALVQIVVHFRFFLHIDLSRQKREDLQLILFTGLLILLMVGGSVWILTSLDYRMMG